MSEPWYQNAVIYGIDVDTFMDGDGDGVGDFRGLTERLDYLRHLGVTCIWLLPFYPTPNRDNGYDIRDYFEVDPRLGTLEDFMRFVRGAKQRGMRVIVDLVVNHTSRDHPWFQASRRDPGSRYRDYYVWETDPPPTPAERGTVFPGQEDSIWTWDDEADAFYYHRFYEHQPDLNIANPEVQDEIERIVDFWLSFGINGFRIDAASHMIERKHESVPADPHAVLKRLRQFVTGRRADAILLGEADEKPEETIRFFGDGDGDELHLLFNFILDNYLFLALARQRAEPIERILMQLPPIPPHATWSNFLRNLDQLDLDRLNDDERAEVLDAFAPEESMRIFGHGVRRRLAPMLGGDRRRIQMAYSLLFSLPGTPCIVYGDELGMGEDLEQQGRNAVRIPMQWSAGRNAGFSAARKRDLMRPVVEDGPFGRGEVNVEAQKGEEGSLLNWLRNLIRLRRDSPELGDCELHVLTSGDERVLCHRIDGRRRSLLILHNLSDQQVSARPDLKIPTEQLEIELVLSDALAVGEPPEAAEREALGTIELAPYGYRWFRILNAYAAG